jgi:hypothetical protein
VARPAEQPAQAADQTMRGGVAEQLRGPLLGIEADARQQSVEAVQQLGVAGDLQTARQTVAAGGRVQAQAQQPEAGRAHGDVGPLSDLGSDAHAAGDRLDD